MKGENMKKHNNDSKSDTLRYLKKLVALSENSLILRLSQEGVSHQTIRKVVGVEMFRVTSLLKYVKTAR